MSAGILCLAFFIWLLVFFSATRVIQRTFGSGLKSLSSFGLIYHVGSSYSYSILTLTPIFFVCLSICQFVYPQFVFPIKIKACHICKTIFNKKSLKSPEKNYHVLASWHLNSAKAREASKRHAEIVVILFV